MLIFHMTVPFMDESEYFRNLYWHSDGLNSPFDEKTEPKKHILVNLRFEAALSSLRISLDFPNWFLSGMMVRIYLNHLPFKVHPTIVFNRSNTVRRDSLFFKRLYFFCPWGHCQRVHFSANFRKNGGQLCEIKSTNYHLRKARHLPASWVSVLTVLSASTH